MNARGAVLVESALALTLILLVVYGSIQLGMVGLEQLTVDGGAFTAAHQKALLGANLKNYEDAPTLAKQTLPHLNSATISGLDPSFGEPPTTDNTGIGQYNVNVTTARHGGVSMIQPIQTVATVKSTNFIAGLVLGLTQQISVSGLAIDPAFRLINGHGDVSGNGFNTAGAFATATDPLADGDNAPPYFAGFNYMKECPAWYVKNLGKPTTTCPSSSVFYGALGLAEYLDVNNWGRTFNGVVPDKQAVFYETRLHQDKFATIARRLLAVAALTPAAILSQKAAILDPVNDVDVGCVYSFDNDEVGSYAVGTKTIGDFPLTPQGNGAFCGP